MADKYLSQDGVRFILKDIFGKLKEKVDKEDGKGLSTNDFTTNEKMKLQTVEEGATNTTIIDNVATEDSTSALSAKQGKVLNDKINAINTGLEDLGAGDMLKSVYDTNNSGVVDDAEKLNGQPASYYATSDIVEEYNYLIWDKFDNGIYDSDYIDDNYFTRDAMDEYYYMKETVDNKLETKSNTNHTHDDYITSSILNSAISGAIADITQFNYETVTQLPSTGEKGVIYLVADDISGDGIYKEYIWLGDKYESFGANIDLSNYIIKTDLVALTNAEIDDIIATAELA